METFNPTIRLLNPDEVTEGDLVLTYNIASKKVEYIKSSNLVAGTPTLNQVALEDNKISVPIKGTEFFESKEANDFAQMQDVSEIYINIDKYGTVGDGVTDDLVSFLDAVDDAKAQERPLYIPKKDYFLKDVETIDLTGIPRVLCDGKLLIEAIEMPDTPWLPTILFSGEKTKIKDSFNVMSRDNQIPLVTSEEIKQGDVMFLLSLNNIDVGRASDYKGQRLTVYKYDSVNNIVYFNERFTYSLTDATLILNSYNPKVYIQGLSMCCTNNVQRAGLSLMYCSAILDNIMLDGFKWAGISVGASNFTIRNYEGSNFFSDAEAIRASYGLTIGDLSLAYSYNLNISGAKHAVAHGGAQSFVKSELGGVGSDFARFESESHIYDSVLSSSKDAALDSHEVGGEVYVYNTTINGGVSLYSKKCDLFDCLVNTIPTGRFNIGAGSYTNINTTINIVESTPIQVQENTYNLNFINCKVKVPNIVVGPFIEYRTNKIETLVVDGLEIISNQDNSFILNIDNVVDVDVRGVYMKNIKGIVFKEYAPRKRVNLNNIKSYLGSGVIRVIKEKIDVFMNDIYIENSSSPSGVLILEGRNIFISNMHSKGGLDSNSVAITSLKSDNLFISNSSFKDSKTSDIRLELGNCVVSNSILNIVTGASLENISYLGCVKSGQLIFDIKEPLKTKDAVLDSQATTKSQVQAMIDL